MKTTSAKCNKKIKQLKDELALLRELEKKSATYLVAMNESPVVPEYDYESTKEKMDAINKEIADIKHAVNLNNVRNTVSMTYEGITVSDTVDRVLVAMAQATERKAVLNEMRKKPEKARFSTYLSTGIPQYECVNYDLEAVNKDYEHVCNLITCYQLALDKYNNGFEFEI